MEENERNNKNIRIILPLFCISLILLIVIIGFVWTPFGRPSEIAQNLNKIRERILGATDQTSVDVGTNVTANFTSATGAVTITSTPGVKGTLDKTKLQSFYNTCGYGNIKTITFENEVYAPEDSRYLFMGGSFYGMELPNLAEINNITNLDTSNVTDMSNMFSGCSSLETIDVSNWNVSSVKSMVSMFSGCSSLTTLDLSNWDVSNVTTMNSMFYKCSSLTTIGDLSNWDTSSVTSWYYVFYNCSSLTAIGDLSNWDTFNVRNMNSMFNKCSSLTTIGGLSNWDISSVTDMYNMFNGCSSLTTLDLSGWDVSGATSLYNMFNGCSSLTTLDLSNWDVSSVKYMDNMFCGCSSLTTVGDLSNWNVSSVTDMTNIFAECRSLTSIGNLSNWNVSKVTGMRSMFYVCSSLTSIGDLSNWDVSSATSMHSMFNKCSSLTSIGNLSNWDVSKVTDMINMFYGCSNLTSVNMSNWDISKVENTTQMLSGCTSLRDIYTPRVYSAQTIDLPSSYYNLDEKDNGSGYTEGEHQVGKYVKATFEEGTGELTIASKTYSSLTAETFEGSVHLSTEAKGTIDKSLLKSFYYTCGIEKIKAITFENEVYAPEDSSDLFEGYHNDNTYTYDSLKNLVTVNNANSLNTSKVTSMDRMFYYCNSLTTIDVSNWNTSKVTSMDRMLYNCNSLTTIDVSNWDTSKVTNMNRMFHGCNSLTTIDVSNWDTSKVTSMDKMFYRCNSLTTLDLSGWNLSEVTRTEEMLSGCISLTDIYTPKIYSAQAIDLPSSDWYNVTNIEDNNTYANFKNDTFTDTVHLRKLADYSITYNLGDGLVIGNPDTYNALDSFTLNNPEKEGYTFTGWTGSNGTTPQTEVTVNGRNVTEDLTYTAHYEINSYELTLNTGTGIKEVTGANIYQYGQEVTINATLLDNTAQYTYGWSNWSSEDIAGSNKQTYTFTMPAKDVILTANGTETINKYLQTVKVRYENGDGTFTEYQNEIEEEYEYGQEVSWSFEETDTYQSARIEAYTVTEEKTTEVTVYRKTYTIVLNKSKGISEVSVTPVSAQYRVGEEITINAEVLEGYIWSKWTSGENEITTKEYTFEMPTGDITYTTNAEPNTDTPYVVKHWQENLNTDGNESTINLENNNSDDVGVGIVSARK